MDTKSNLGIKTKLNELAVNHNRLTTLCAFLLNEIAGLKKEMHSMKSNNSSGNYNPNDIKTINTSDSSHNNQSPSHPSQNNYNNNYNNSTPNFSELKADEILKQLSLNNTDN